ncbi:phospholipid-transporting ATPase IK-like [Pyxicephalus adspersus]|uniref:phospholipid-transporting ATPase IK-like n=1 Tax=Pyxicephalus adspersus TaxID=30357 RepID=UPI003B5CE384
MAVLVGCSWMTNKTTADYNWEVKANDNHYHEKIKQGGFLCFRKKKYCDNRIKTSKYNIFTFIPLNLYEQYHKAQVIYFTFVLILQSIPEISTLPVYSVTAPLICILVARAIRDLITDIARHRNDKLVNNAPCEILKDKRMQKKKWKDVQVGDIVRVKKDEFVPADMLLLHSTEADSLCYIETAGIDGETNLKFRQALAVTHSNLNTVEALAEFDGLVTCEAPNARIYSFVGVLEWKGKQYPLNSENLLLRDCRIRNTECCYGLVLYAGFDTKIMKNSGKIFLKFTKTDLLINKIVLCIAAFVIISSFIMGIGGGIWDSLYLEKHYYLPKHPEYSSAAFVFFAFMGYLATIATLVPFTLYIALEIIHNLHNFFINNDLEMYYKESDTPAHARSTSFCDMLGQIEYLFTDKTGTLTQNIMTFKKCCIGDKTFGMSSIEEQQHQEVNFDWNPYADTSFRFCDQALIDELRNDPKDPLLHEFFRAIALCHSVMADNEKGVVRYKATSPDEEALVTAARNFGYVFITRTQDSITISEMGEIKTYSILAMMDFNSDRKRMSIIVRNEEGIIRLYSKGADSVILERMHQDCETEVLQEALNQFAEDTLRTLCLACKDIGEQEYLIWEESYNKASLTLENRQDHLDKVYEDMEQSLKLLGATAIEDKLQEGVPETIQLLRDGNIKVWMLTGDKKETAINIAYSCNLLSNDVKLLEEDELRNLLDGNQQNGNTDDTLKANDPNEIKESNMTALVVTGEFLSGFLNMSEEGAPKLPWWKRLIWKRKTEDLTHQNSELKALVELACQCQCVICCRVTPQQKASIVQLVKMNKKVTTLAIGDGGNDVNMIKTAHIGVGVIGKEGLQAVLASEFAVAQFAYLQNLLFFHGRLSYARISKFLCYYNYKTFASLVHNLWYSFFNCFTSLPMFEPWYLVLNAILYTLYPSLCMGILDKDMDSKGSRQHPELYIIGQKDQCLGLRILVHVLYGVYTSLVVFFVFYFAFFDSAGPHGIFTYQVFAYTMSTLYVLAVSAEAVLTISSWSVLTLLAFLISPGSYFLVTYLTALPSAYFFSQSEFNFLDVMVVSLGSGYVWLLFLLGIILSIIPSLIWRFCSGLSSPSLTKPLSKKKNLVQVPFRNKKAPRRQSSFAFSYTEGLEKFVTRSKVHREDQKEKTVSWE